MTFSPKICKDNKNVRVRFEGNEDDTGSKPLGKNVFPVFFLFFFLFQKIQNATNLRFYNA